MIRFVQTLYFDLNPKDCRVTLNLDLPSYVDKLIDLNLPRKAIIETLISNGLSIASAYRHISKNCLAFNDHKESIRILKILCIFLRSYLTYSFRIKS